MNILVTSAGRRVKIVEYLKNTIQELNGHVIATDCDINAPAIHFADACEIVPRIDDPNYIDHIIQLCEKHDITGIISLIDPELELLAKSQKQFEEKDIKLILSPNEIVEIAFDKYETHRYLSGKGIPSVPTYNSLEEVIQLLESKDISFPLVVKPAKGSASLGIHIVYTKEELKTAFALDEENIIQPFYNDKEFGVDVYIDMESGDLVDLFIKEKIRMRSGETDKSVSIHNDKIENLIREVIEATNFRGPIDIDCFEYKGEYYISEINPRFGGGYPHAYEMGCNFMKYITHNLSGKTNETYKTYRYKDGYVMMKFDHLKIMRMQG